MERCGQERVGVSNSFVAQLHERQLSCRSLTFSRPAAASDLEQVGGSLLLRETDSGSRKKS